MSSTEDSLNLDSQTMDEIQSVIKNEIGHESFNELLGNGVNYSYTASSDDDTYKVELTYPLQYPTDPTYYQMAQPLGLSQHQYMTTDPTVYEPPVMHAVAPYGDVSHYPAPSTSPSPMSPIPSRNTYSGDINFCFEFDRQTKDTKSTPWTFSTLNNKLYARIDVPCPIRFKADKHNDQQLYIRALPIYTKSEHVSDSVKRCPNHIQARESANIPHREHFIWCEHQGTSYVKDPNTNRCAVIVPFDPPAAGSDWTTYLYSFKCLNSCPGGINRRDTSVVFTLENERNEVLGRHCIDLRICACPGRDKAGEEKKTNIANSPTPPPATTSRNQVAEPDVGLVNRPPSTPSAQKRLHPDTEVFTLQIRGRSNYELLKTVRDSLEMSEQLIPKRERENFDRQRRNQESRVPPVQAPPPTRAPVVSRPMNPTFTQPPVFTFSSATRLPAQQRPPFAQGSFTQRGGFDMTDGGSVSASSSLTIVDWLKTLRLEAYADDFHKIGFHSMDQIKTDKNFRIKHLQEMNLTKPTISKLWTELQRYRATLRDDEGITSTQPLSDSQASTVTLSQSSSEGSVGSRQSTGGFRPAMMGFPSCLKLTIIKKKSNAGASTSASTSTSRPTSSNETQTSEGEPELKRMKAE